MKYKSVNKIIRELEEIFNVNPTELTLAWYDKNTRLVCYFGGLCRAKAGHIEKYLANRYNNISFIYQE